MCASDDEKSACSTAPLAGSAHQRSTRPCSGLPIWQKAPVGRIRARPLNRPTAAAGALQLRSRRTKRPLSRWRICRSHRRCVYRGAHSRRHFVAGRFGKTRPKGPTSVAPRPSMRLSDVRAPAYKKPRAKSASGVGGRGLGDSAQKPTPNIRTRALKVISKGQRSSSRRVFFFFSKSAKGL